MAEKPRVQPRLLADTLPSDIDAKLAEINDHLPFYLHFGHFISVYASAESSFHEFFHSMCGLDETQARVLIGNEPIGKVANVCNRLIQIGPWEPERKGEFQIVIDQMNAITRFRSDLVHRGVERIKGGITSSNAVTAKSAASVERLRFNLDHMKDATADLTRIILELFVIRSPEMGQRARQRGSAVHAALSQPWRYKRIEPDNPNQPPRKGGQ
jgi:hypothetical protein